MKLIKKRNFVSIVLSAQYALVVGTMLFASSCALAQGVANGSSAGETAVDTTTNKEPQSGRLNENRAVTSNNSTSSNNTGLNSSSPDNGTSSLNTGRSNTAPVNNSGGRDTIEGNNLMTERGAATNSSTPLLYAGTLFVFLTILFVFSRIGKKDPQPGRGNPDPDAR